MEHSFRKKIIITIIAGIVAGIFTLGAAFITGLFNRPAPENELPIVLINEPANGQVIEEQFVAKGRVERYPKGYYIWLGVQINDLIWPKAEITRVEQVWEKSISEDGKTGQEFNLVAFSVRKKGHNDILKWFRNEDFKGISSLEDITILHTVSLKLE